MLRVAKREELAQALAIEVLRFLRLAREASASQEGRTQILEVLFANLCRSMDVPTLSRIMDSVPADRSVFFFELVADFFASHADEGSDVHAICSSMLAHPYLPPLYCLLFYRCSCASVSLPRLNILLRGANRLFWTDIDRNKRTFESVYLFIKSDWLEQLSSPAFQGMPWSAKVDLLALCCRVFFYYDRPHRCPAFVAEMQTMLTLCLSAGSYYRSPEKLSSAGRHRHPRAETSSKHTQRRSSTVPRDVPVVVPAEQIDGQQQAVSDPGPMDILFDNAVGGDGGRDSDGNKDGHRVDAAADAATVGSDQLREQYVDLGGMSLTEMSIGLNSSPADLMLPSTGSTVPVLSSTSAAVDAGGVSGIGESLLRGEGAADSHLSRSNSISSSSSSRNGSGVDLAAQEEVEILQRADRSLGESILSAAAQAEKQLDALSSVSLAASGSLDKSISVAELFVRESLLQISLMRQKHAVVLYLQGFMFTKSLRLSEESRVQLHTTLYAFTAPAGHDREVRKIARHTFETLFPEGALARHMWSTVFRFAHGFGWTKSLFQWGIEKIVFVKNTLLFLRNLLPLTSSKGTPPVLKDVSG